MNILTNTKFYHFDHPDYDTDYAHSYHNPIELVHEISVPAIKCDVCGEHWFNVASRIPVNWPEDKELLEKLEKPVLSSSEHKLLYERFQEDTGIKIDKGKFPGATIGRASIKIKRKLKSEILWLWLPARVFITPEVVNALNEIEAKGCVFYPVNIVESKVNNPELYELIVTGKAGPAAKESNITIVKSCSVCGYDLDSPIVNGLRVDPKNWDGSDFCVVDEYPTYILVSERIKKLFEEKGFRNYQLINSEEVD